MKRYIKSSTDYISEVGQTLTHIQVKKVIAENLRWSDSLSKGLFKQVKFD